MMDAVLKLRVALVVAQAVLNTADFASNTLTPESEAGIGGDFDVPDGWETVRMQVKNLHGTTIELMLKFEVVTSLNSEDTVVLTPCLEGYYIPEGIKNGTFPVHRFRTGEDIAVEEDVRTSIVAVMEGLLATAAYILPEDVAGDSWINVIVGDLELI